MNNYHKLVGSYSTNTDSYRNMGVRMPNGMSNGMPYGTRSPGLNQMLPPLDSMYGQREMISIYPQIASVSGQPLTSQMGQIGSYHQGYPETYSNYQLYSPLYFSYPLFDDLFNPKRNIFDPRYLEFFAQNKNRYGLAISNMDLFNTCRS